MANVLWLQGGACSGNTMSFLNAEEPTVVELVVDFGINILWHPTCGLQIGHQVSDLMKDCISGKTALDILVFEGTLIEGPNGTGTMNNFCERPMKDWVKELSKVASYVVAIGDCATWGGIPAVPPNPSESTGDRAEHAPTVEREARHHVEDAERDVHRTQVAGDGLHRLEAGSGRDCLDQEAEPTQGEARGRAGNCHEELRTRARRLLGEVGDATEHEERDGRDLHLEGARDDGVRELVRHDRREEEERGHGRNEQSLPFGPERVRLGEDPVGEREEDQAKDEDP